MTAETRTLYREVIVEHGKRPRNFRSLGGGARTADGYNPVCGDAITVAVDLTDGRLRDVAFQGASCAVCTASASLMSEAVKGLSVAEAGMLAERFRALVTGDGSSPAPATLGTLAVFAGVRAFPSRIKCALLPWETLRRVMQPQPPDAAP